MLRVILVTAPSDAAQVDLLAEHLRSEAFTEVYTPETLVEAARALGRPHALQGRVEPRLETPEGALALIQEVAAASEGTVALLAAEDVARAVVVHALEAPVAAERLAFDPGGYAEVEVRLDAPWTVNRLNERCYQDAEPSE